MKKLSTSTLIKLLIVLVILGAMIISAKVIYDNLSKGMRVNPLLVESYRPHLETDLVKKAATALKAKSQE